MSALPMPRATIAEIAAMRDATLAAYGEAHEMVSRANAKLREAAGLAKAAAPLAERNPLANEKRDKVFASYDVAEGDAFRAIARHMVDADCWSHVIRATELDILMDKKAKDEFRQGLEVDPPEFTEENAVATLERFAAEAGMIFRRGIAEAFSALDRRFRSHSGWKIGNRIILSSAFDQFGWWNHYRRHQDTLADIERTFLILDDKKPTASYAGIVGAVEARRNEGNFAPNKWGCSDGPTVVEGDYFRIRVFKNGNAHLRFTRDDLVEKANRMIGEYYGEVIPEERTYDEDDGGLFTPKTTPAKNFGFFPTPPALADSIIEQAALHRGDGLTVLEPSAGTGALAIRAAKKGAIVDCIEVQTDLALQIIAQRRFRRVIGSDFLAIDPATTGLYDRVIMNPPFDRERDIDHVVHALKFLKDDGFLIAIMSAHTEFAESRKAKAFRDMITKMSGQFRDNPAGSFSSVGTNVNTLTLRVYKDGRTVW